MSTASVDESAKKVEEAGGNVLMPKVAIPGVGYFIMCKDTEGNMFGVMEMDSSAK